MYSVEDFLIRVYCLIDDLYPKVLQGQRIRRTGPAPALSDVEVLTMEVVGEYFGHNNNTAIWRYFTNHWKTWFPRLGHRTRFGQQAKRLRLVKKRMFEAIVHWLQGQGDLLYVVDGFPLVTSGFTRGPMRKRFTDIDGLGYCASKKMKYYGLKAHLLIHSSGLIVGMSLTAANGNERLAADSLLGCGQSVVLGDKGYLDGPWQALLESERGLRLITAYRKNMTAQRQGLEKWLLKWRRRLVETVVGQLEERLGLKRIWARDLPNLESRLARKLLAHTISVYFNLLLGRPPLQLQGLLKN